MNANKSVKILAIDDDKDILYTLEAIGRMMGWTVYTDSDSLNAVKKIKSFRPDLVLIDYHMPNQDGLSAVRAIRSLDKSVPIIVLTVDERQEIAERFLDAGASDFANKPIKVADLAARINVHMRLVDRQKISPDILCEKGINSATLELIRDYCRRADAPFLIEEAVDHVGLAYQTTFRYLQFLETKKELAVTSDYGKVGRPRKRYRYISPL